jgi:NDP-sugar pyrophosphorylase family protein
MDDLCAVILAAGAGTRLRPLTAIRTKALCPVGNVPLLDRALRRLEGVDLSGPGKVAVNACYLADQIVDHVGGRARVRVEPGPRALGTAGGIGNLQDWIAGRPVLVANGDAYLHDAFHPPGEDIARLLAGWNGDTVRILVVPPAPGRRPEFSGMCFAGFTLLPAADAAGLQARESDLVFEVWRPAERTGRLELIRYDGVFLDTGTMADYLAANVHAAIAAGGNLIGPGATGLGAAEHSSIGAYARVDGKLTRAVVWPGATVGPDEHVIDAVRIGHDLTVR